MSYFIYYQPIAVEEGHTGDCVNKYATIEEAFLAKVQLEAEGNRDIKILKEIQVKVEVIS